MKTGRKKIILSIISGVLFSTSLFLIFATLCGCEKETALADTATVQSSVDYADASNWLSVPATTQQADIFYLYPTCYQKILPADPNICGIDNAVMRHFAALAFDRQATAFATSGNIYAPFYRQADAAYTLSLPEDQRAAVIKGLPLGDATNAFDHYIRHFNKGRPFILAGHSQGSNVLIYLLAGYMKTHPEVYSRMVAAYIIGYSVTPEFLSANPHLRFAEGPDDLGVIISYNTQADSVNPPGNPVVLPGALAINPITWTTAETHAPASANLGSIMLKSDGSVIKDSHGQPVKVLNFADARADHLKNALICSTVNVDTFAPGNNVFPRGVFHSFDYPFYYFNLRDNARNRVNLWFAKH